MGSQIFDYWFDPSKFILEHYIDGDLVNDQTPINETLAAPDNLHVWGKIELLRVVLRLADICRSSCAGYFFGVMVQSAILGDRAMDLGFNLGFEAG